MEFCLFLFFVLWSTSHYQMSVWAHVLDGQLQFSIFLFWVHLKKWSKENTSLLLEKFKNIPGVWNIVLLYSFTSILCNCVFSGAGTLSWYSLTFCAMYSLDRVNSIFLFHYGYLQMKRWQHIFNARCLLTVIKTFILSYMRLILSCNKEITGVATFFFWTDYT